jgi:opacity protein-like surface antigen
VGGIYSQKGAEASEGGVTAAIELGYFEIPVLLRYAFPSGGAASFHLLGGPSVRFEVGCSISGSDGSTSASVDCSDAELDTKSFDFGLTGGLGLDFQASESLIITVDGLYNLGLSNIAEDGDAKNRVFMLQAGVGFPLGG